MSDARKKPELRTDPMGQLQAQSFFMKKSSSPQITLTGVLSVSTFSSE
jgi:hypothetical protein